MQSKDLVSLPRDPSPAFARTGSKEKIFKLNAQDDALKKLVDPSTFVEDKIAYEKAILFYDSANGVV
ncbi:MAG: hypothetical protein CMI52_04125 [Parcubacteria group bacterium]|nr:hypothetical protein [Parcubacteria group bacterium]